MGLCHLLRAKFCNFNIFLTRITRIYTRIALLFLTTNFTNFLIWSVPVQMFLITNFTNFLILLIWSVLGLIIGTPLISEIRKFVKFAAKKQRNSCNFFQKRRIRIAPVLRIYLMTFKVVKRLKAILATIQRFTSR